LLIAACLSLACDTVERDTRTTSARATAPDGGHDAAPADGTDTGLPAPAIDAALPPPTGDLPVELIGVDLSDPPPLEASRAGEVRVPSSRVLMEWKERSYPGALTVYNLDTGDAHAAGRGDFYEVVSAQGSVLLLSGANAAASGALRMVRMTAGGFAPETPVAGYENVSGNFYDEGHLEDTRFQLFARRTGGTGMTMSIEVVDTALGRRHGAVDDPFGADQSATAALHGYYFTAVFTKMENQQRSQAWGWAKVTAQGVTPLVYLPDDTTSAVFSGDGRYLFYARGAPFVQGQPTQPRELRVLRLPNRVRDEPPLATDLSFDGMLVPGEGDSIYARATSADAKTQVWYQIDPRGQVSALTDATRFANTIALSGDLGVVSYKSDTDAASTERVLVQRSSGTTRSLAITTSDQAAQSRVRLTAHHALYTDAGALHAVGFEGAEARDVVLADAAELNGTSCVAVDGELLTFNAKDGFVFVSLAEATAKRILKLTTPAAGTQQCLRRHPSKPLFLYNEVTPSDVTLWTVEATSERVGTPTMRLALDAMPGATLSTLLFGG
jgi:hypothetical protein